MTVDRNVVKGCLTTIICALMKSATEDHTAQWNNPFLPKFLEWCESEWGNGRLEVRAIK